MAPDTLLIGRGARPALLRLDRANRHGLVAGATGTGKTVTLQVLAEGFSDAGVPVFCADIKGDLAGLGQPGRPDPKFEARARELGVGDYGWRPCPAVYWDVFGAQGHPMRATVAEMGPLLVVRMLELNDAQEGVLAVAFAVADDQGLLLLDLKDLRAILGHLAENAAEIGQHYGHVGRATVATIQRRLLVLEQAGAEAFLGEPALELSDLMLVSPEGRGAVNVLAADVLVRTPRLYAAFLLWLLSELFEALPEAGDLDRPKLVFFFDEAHLLFADAPRALVEKVEQVVRLIRSKGVGVYFVTQNPLDLPPAVLGQLGNRVQHALRAFTPSEQKAVRAAAATFRPDPRLDVERAIGELAVGEALVSTLQEDGTPSMVDRVRIVPPRSRMGTVTADERAAAMARSPLAGRYDAAVDRESAYELLSGRAGTAPAEAGPHRPAGVRDDDPWGGAAGRPAPGGWGTPTTAAPEPPRRARRSSPPPPPETGGLGGLLSGLLAGDGRREGAGQALAKSAARSLGTRVGGQLGQAVVRGLLGSILRR